MFAGASVLITGGTGSFGTACIRTLLDGADAPRRVICYSRDELKQQQLTETIDDPRLRCFLGDVRDPERLALALHDVQYVLHAAALKQVPALEYNPTEAIRTNVLGSMHLVQACLGTDVRKVVALSTDKAVAPLNLYGATKLCMERLLVAAHHYRGRATHPTFSLVRYGNVAGSRGSVIPLWRARQRLGLPILLTHAEATRFWVSLPHVVGFALSALCEAEGGEIFVPKLPSVRLAELAGCFTDAWRLSGLRAGEKLHETLISADEPHWRDCTWAYVGHAESTIGVPVPAGFSYRSDQNAEWLTGTALHTALAEVP